jgi:hypothetical protein
MAESTKKAGSGQRASAADLTRAAKETIEDLTGFTPESVSGLQWDGETWLVSVEVCELERIPNTTDVLATYVVQLDDRAGLQGYKRSRRYQRGHSEEG